MPELPEIAVLAREMKAELVGRVFERIEVLQPRCLNMTKRSFVKALTGAKIVDVTQRGKWAMVETSQGWLLLCLGMGGEVLLVHPDHLPKKYRLVFYFVDGEALAVNFWWFGYAHYVPAGRLGRHRMTAKLGPNALDLSPAELWSRLAGRRGQVKAFLLDQSKIAGIGNAYIHDILFLARLHPMRSIKSLTPEDGDRLAQAIRAGLLPSLNKGGSFYEMDLYGQKGKFSMDDILIGYKAGKPCPVCGTPIEKLQTGGTTGFICPQCQPRKV
jgi:formamidopyrimidine-DNA glycosylase